MDSGEKNESPSRLAMYLFKFRLVFVAALVVLILLVLIAPPPIAENRTKAVLMQTLSNTRQIYTQMQSAALDAATTGHGAVALPADAGIKSGVEYVRYLVKQGAFKESDLRLFCKRGHTPRTLAELKAGDLAFRFANVSMKDDPNTVFLVSRNVVEATTAPAPAQSKWWQFFSRSEDDYPVTKGYIAFTRGGDGRFFMKLPADWSQFGALPPREPKFLEP